jgi:hypothetical protein
MPFRPPQSSNRNRTQLCLEIRQGWTTSETTRLRLARDRRRKRRSRDAGLRSARRSMTMVCQFPGTHLIGCGARSAFARLRRSCSTRRVHIVRAADDREKNAPAERRGRAQRQFGQDEMNKIRGIFSRSAYWAERVRLMQHWSDHLHACATGRPRSRSAGRRPS